MKIKPWTWMLLCLILVDSIFTVYIGRESNPLILWTMNKFNISLSVAMIARIFYCFPLLYILNKMDFSRLTFVLYSGIYILCTGVQFI